MLRHFDPEVIANRMLGEMRLRGAFGRANAVTRASLLETINRERASLEDPNFPERRFAPIKDVEFRAVYRDLPICSCDDGLYFPVTADDLEAFRLYMRAKAIPLFDRVKRIAEAYPDLVRDPRQLSLEI
jgi:hypothetical protein